MATNKKNVTWIEGLRGMASASVVITHLFRSFYWRSFYPVDAEGASPVFWQLPFVRVLTQGRIGVAIFAFLTGFVCSLKPLKLARAGQHHEALATVAKSTFRRIPRLVLPSTLVIVIAWLMAQLGAFELGHRTDSAWTRSASPKPSEDIVSCFVDLWDDVRGNWSTHWSRYDVNQWTMIWLLRESLLAFLSLSATVFMTYKWRVGTYAFLFCYWYQNTLPLTETFQGLLYFSMLLCDFSLHPAGHAFLARHQRACNIASPLLVVAGIYLASYPQDGHPEWIAWSRQLQSLGAWIFPRGVNLARRYTALGLELVIAGLFISDGAKDVLSNAFFMWLGRHSFAVYLLHGTLLRTVLVWLLYGFRAEAAPARMVGEHGDVVEEWIPKPGVWRFGVAVPAWLALVYGCTHLWTEHVDGFCADVARRMEDWAFEKEDKEAEVV